MWPFGLGLGDKPQNEYLVRFEEHFGTGFTSKMPQHLDRIA